MIDHVFYKHLKYPVPVMCQSGELSNAGSVCNELHRHSQESKDATAENRNWEF